MMPSAAIALSLDDLLAFDPHHTQKEGERDCCCPLCGTQKRVDAAHRSLSYNARTGLFRCARCGAKGILREWIAKKEPHSERHSDPRYAARVRFRKHLALPPLNAPSVGQATSDISASQTPQQKHWREMLERANLIPIAQTLAEKYLCGQRGLPIDVCQDAEVRFTTAFFGRPAAVFPIRDTKGGLVAAQGRYIDEKDNPRMRTVGEKKSGVFWAASNGSELRSQPPVRRWLTVTEAPIDALTLTACGVPGAIVALCGCDGVPKDLTLCAAFGTVYLAFDADEAGDKATVLLAPLFQAMGATVLRLRPSDVKDWNESLIRHGRQTLETCLCAFPGCSRHRYSF